MKRLAYAYLKLVVTIAQWVYFRRIEVNGNRKAGCGKAALYTVRHSNALMDPLMVSPFIPRNLYFLARADVFQNKFVASILTMLNMIPVFRIQDGWSAMDRNDATFAKCRALLAKGKGIQIFPEGIHSEAHRLLPLKKGSARILLPAMAENPGLDIAVVPVGLNYSDARMFRATVSLNFGQILWARKYFDAENPTDPDRIARMTEDLQELLRPEVLDLREPAPYDVANAIRQAMEMDAFGIEEANFAASKLICEQIVSAYGSAEKQQRLAPLAAKHAALRQEMDFPEAGMPQLGHVNGPSALRRVLFCLLAPLAFLGMLLHGPALILANRAPRLVKDQIFYGAVRMISGMFLVQGLYLVYFLVAWALFSSALCAGAFLLGTALAGLLALPCYDTLMDWRRALRIRRFGIKNPAEAAKLQALQGEMAAVLG